jgi:hypothetical protein
MESLGGLGGIYLKSLEEIINQEPIFFNDWKNKIDVLTDFAGDRWKTDKEKEKEFIEANKDINILFVSYSYMDYDGYAWVLFEKDGKLYEVNGSHSSWYGLEGQWEPEEVSLRELEHRLIKGTWGEDDFKTELCKFLGVIQG